MYYKSTCTRLSHLVPCRKGGHKANPRKKAPPTPPNRTEEEEDDEEVIEEVIEEEDDDEEEEAAAPVTVFRQNKKTTTTDVGGVIPKTIVTTGQTVATALTASELEYETTMKKNGSFSTKKQKLEAVKEHAVTFFHTVKFIVNDHEMEYTGKYAAFFVKKMGIQAHEQELWWETGAKKAIRKEVDALRSRKSTMIKNAFMGKHQ
jgi:hypothetical protein